jgi:hypothetical protein
MNNKSETIGYGMKGSWHNQRYYDFPGGAEENHKNLSDDSRNPGPPEY